MVSEDRHNPLPHIALSTTALKSAYEITTSMSRCNSSELRELLILGRAGMAAPGLFSSSADVAGLREVCYRAKVDVFQVG